MGARLERGGGVTGFGVEDVLEAPINSFLDADTLAILLLGEVAGMARIG
jgi:hypothetical protein